MKKKYLAPLVFSLIMCTGIKGISQSVSDLKKTINEKYREYISGFASKNYNAIANLYTPDGSRLSKGDSTIAGRENIARSLKRMLDSTGPVNVIIQSNELWHMDGKLYEGGKWFYSWQGNDNNIVLIQGNYFTIWSQSEGEWKIWRDISVSSPYFSATVS